MNGKHWIAALCAMAMALWAAVAPAAAQSGMQRPADLYEVAGVRVFAEGPSLQEARTEAIAGGQSEALRRLAVRLTPPAQHGQLRYLSFGRTAVEDLLVGYDIAEEKRTPTTYQADLTVVFDAVAVRQWLDRAGLNLIEARDRALLVVPRAGGTDPATEALWRQAWARAGLANEPAPLLVPSENALSQINAEPGWSIGLDAEMNRLGVAGAVFADWTLQEQGGQAVVDVTLSRLVAGGQMARVGSVRASGPVPPAGSARPDALIELFRDAARQSSQLISGPWKASAVVDTNVSTRAEGVILFRDAAEWRKISLALQDASLIKEYQLQAVSVDGAMAQLVYAGQFEQIARELAAKGIAARQTGLGSIELSVDGGRR